MVTSQKLGASVSNVVEVLAETPPLRLTKFLSLGLPFRTGGAGNHLIPCHTFLQGCEGTENWGWHYPTLIAWHVRDSSLWGEVTLSWRPTAHDTTLIQNLCLEFGTPGNIKKHQVTVWNFLAWRSWVFSLNVFLIYNMFPWLKIQKDIKREAFLPPLFYTNKQ